MKLHQNLALRKNPKKKKTFSRALTSTTVLVSSAMRLSLVALATSCGVLGLDGLKKEKDMMIGQTFEMIRNDPKFNSLNFALMKDLQIQKRKRDWLVCC